MFPTVKPSPLIGSEITMALFQVLCKIKLVGSHSNSLHRLCLFFLHWVICGKPLNLLQTIWKNTYFSEVLTALICLWMFSTVLYLQSTQQCMVGGWETREKVRTRGVPNGDKKKAFKYDDWERFWRACAVSFLWSFQDQTGKIPKQNYQTSYETLLWEGVWTK